MSQAAQGLTRTEFFRANRLQLSIFVIFLLIWLIYILAAPLAFTSLPLYSAFMSTMPFFGIIALSMTFVVTLGEIDISFPSIVGISSYFFAWLIDHGYGFPLAFIVCIATGAFAGLINGIMVAKIGIPSIVATIAMMFFWRGLVNVLAQGKGAAIVSANEAWHHALFVGRLFEVIPAQFLWFIAFAIVLGLIYRYHRFGNHVHFVGDNPRSAQMMGINVDRVKIIAFVQLGAISAFAGLFALYELLYFWPSQGSGLLLTTLAAVFIGGTSVFGGKGTIFGTFIGVLIIGSIESGIVAMGLSGFWVQFFYGLFIAAAVTIYALISKRRS
jgi:simple sugar transport system permease protein